MMRLYALMYDMAVNRPDSSSLRRTAQEKIADSRNTKRSMRIIQCALIG